MSTSSDPHPFALAEFDESSGAATGPSSAGPGSAGRRASPASRTTRPGPHLRHERSLLRSGARLVAGMDEVGRGSLAGPVSVGVVVVDVTTRSAPRGVADSKLLTPAARVALLPALGRWGLARAVGHASAAEIDEVGIIAALRLAGNRALARACEVTGPVDVVLLDGKHDWLTPPAQGELFESGSPALGELGLGTGPLGSPVHDGDERDVRAAPSVHLRIKADRTCASVAAASVIAKCERDALMIDLAREHPAYRWDENKGYSSPDHLLALHSLGPSVLHRRSWRLPLGGPGGEVLDARADAGAGLSAGRPAGSPGGLPGLLPLGQPADLPVGAPADPLDVLVVPGAAGSPSASRGG